MTLNSAPGKTWRTIERHQQNEKPMPHYIIQALRNSATLRETVFDSPTIEDALASAKDVWRDLGDVSWLALQGENYPDLVRHYAGMFRAIRSKQTGVPFHVRIVNQGDRYGLHGKLRHEDSQPMVEFYDARGTAQQREQFGPWGIFVQRYNLLTLCKGKHSFGIDLQGDVEAWKIDAESFAPLLADLRKLALAYRIFVGIFPGGVSYSDRTRERGGDWVRLAFLPYDSLELRVENDCPAEMREWIIADAAKIQARKGQQFSISASGQTVMLGK